MRSCAPEPLRAHGGTCAPTAHVRCARPDLRPFAGRGFPETPSGGTPAVPPSSRAGDGRARRAGGVVRPRAAHRRVPARPARRARRRPRAARAHLARRRRRPVRGTAPAVAGRRRGAARHADRARRPGRRRTRQLPGRHVGQHRDLAAAGLVDGGRRARDGGGRRPGQGPWTDRGGPRGHPDGGAGPRRRDGGSRRGVERAAHRARRIRRDGGRRRRRGLRRRLRRHGRGGLAGLAPQRADARRDRRRPGRDGEQPGRCRGGLDDGPEAAVHRDHGEHRPGARTGPAPHGRRRRRRPGRRVRVLADRGPRPAADGRSHLALVRGGPARHRPPGVRRRGRAWSRPPRTWRCGRCGASPARRCPTTPPPA